MFAGYPLRFNLLLLPLLFFLLSVGFKSSSYGIRYLEQTFQEAVFMQQPEIYDNNVTQLASQTVEIKRIEQDRRQSWLFIILTLQLVLIAYLRASFGKSFEELSKGFMNINIAQQIAREQELSLPISSIIFNLNFVISLSVFGYLLLGYFDINTVPYHFQFFALIVLCVAILYFVKYVVLKLLGNIFPISEEMDDYNFNFFLVQKIIGLVIIPFNFLIAYAPNSLVKLFVILSLLAIAILVIFRILKGLVIGKNYYLRNKFHFFLYICTLEIAPILIIVKLLSSWMR